MCSPQRLAWFYQCGNKSRPALLRSDIIPVLLHTSTRFPPPPPPPPPRPCAPPPKHTHARAGQLMAVQDPLTQQPLSLQQLKSELVIATLAGFETTSNALSWTLGSLAAHSAAMAALEQVGVPWCRRGGLLACVCRGVTFEGGGGEGCAWACWCLFFEGPGGVRGGDIWGCWLVSGVIGCAESHLSRNADRRQSRFALTAGTAATACVSPASCVCVYMCSGACGCRAAGGSRQPAPPSL